MSGIYQVVAYGDQFCACFQFNNEARAKACVQFFDSQLDDNTETEFGELYMTKFHTENCFMIQHDRPFYEQVKEDMRQIERPYETDFNDLWESFTGFHDYVPRQTGLEVNLHNLNDENGESQLILLQEGDYVGLLAEDIQAVG